MKVFRRALLTLVGLLVAAAAWLRGRDPESITLDARARTGVEGQWLTLRDGVTHYQLSGPDSGARVLLVHGFSVPAYIWDSTEVALVAAGFRVARYDQFGRGWSDRPNVAYDNALYQRQMEDLLDSLGWNAPVHIVGLSMGGLISASFVGDHPLRARSLTLVDPAAGPAGVVPWYLSMPWLGERLFRALALPGMADGQLTDFVEPARWPDWPDKYRPQMAYQGFGRALLRTLIAGQGVSRDSVFGRVGAAGTPTLLVWGKEDRTVSIEHATSVRAAIPQAQYHAIDSAGHLPHMERPGVVHPVLIEFLRSTEPRSDSGTAAGRSRLLMSVRE
jgi:pimeloyl-ACP methyl ester carboxylesterase